MCKSAEDDPCTPCHYLDNPASLATTDYFEFFCLEQTYHIEKKELTKIYRKF
jgi:hypothetical protein